MRANQEATNSLFDRYSVMSMRLASFTERANTAEYVVVAPHPTDVLAGSLRAAYAAELTAYEQFGDLFRQLDLVESIPQRH